jgi:hypothetical protein
MHLCASACWLLRLQADRSDEPEHCQLVCPHTLTVTLQSQAQQQFSVTVSGSQDTAVAWNIVDAAGHVHQLGDSTVGTVTAGGLYTAPTVGISMSITLYAGGGLRSQSGAQNLIQTGRSARYGFR